MSDALSSLNSFLLDPANHDFLAIIKGIRNGLVYGAKIRFPHALVMTVLFRGGTPSSQAKAILQATRQHATNLGTFVFLYKTITIVLRRLALTATLHKVRRSSGEASEHSLIAGMVAGYVVFGRLNAANSSVNQQIVIYVFARVVLGLAKLLMMPAEPRPSTYQFQAGYGPVQKGGVGLLDTVFGNESKDALLKGLSNERRERYKRVIARNSWPVFATVSWGLVMWLFRWHPDVLQPSLRSSMKYLYENAEKWDGVKTWIWHNS